MNIRPYTALGVLALLIALPASHGCRKEGGGPGKGNGTTPTAGTTGTTGTGGERPRTEFKVSAAEMAKEFIADAKAAESKYKDKGVELTGQVAQVISGERLVVSLEGAKKNEKDIVGVSVNCYLVPASQDVGARATKGQKVRATGVYRSKFASVLQVMDCTLEALEPSKIHEVTAEALAAEFQKDPEGAAKKYRDQSVIVTGEIADLPEKGGFRYATLKGKGPVNIRITMGPEDISKLQKGQTVSLRGEGTFPELNNNEVSFDAGFIVGAKK